MNGICKTITDFLHMRYEILHNSQRYFILIDYLLGQTKFGTMFEHWPTSQENLPPWYEDHLLLTVNKIIPFNKDNYIESILYMQKLLALK